MAKQQNLNQEGFQKFLNDVNNKYGAGSTMTGNEVIKIERSKTGSINLDIITGGGWGRGRMHELYGPESSGKTTLCIMSMIETQKAMGRVVFVDAEHAFDRTYAEKLGLDMSRVTISQPDNGEMALDIVDMLISSGHVDLCVVDSIAALTPKAELEGEMGDSQMGLHARLMSKALRKLTATVNRTGTVLIFTNQLRSKIGVVYGNPEVTTGGNAMKFYASIRVDMRASKGEDSSEGQRITSKITCKTAKNKLAAPFQNCTFDINFGEGIVKEGEILDLCVINNVVKKSGSWFSYGETRLGQGRSAVITMLRDNPELCEELEGIIYKLYEINEGE